MTWAWIEGSRTFDITWGIVTAAACLAIAVPVLWWWLPAHRRPLFHRRVDPRFRVQLGVGLFAMAMAWTDLLCRAIPHGEIPFVHPAFFTITVLLVVLAGPRVAWVALRGPRLETRASPV